jgi:hypothetical protein
MTMKLNFYTDSGHGWLAVKRDLLVKLGIADKISTYSYQRGETAYLEEDCDASEFLSAARQAGLDMQFTDRHTNGRHPIRSYATYHP